MKQDTIASIMIQKTGSKLHII